MTTATTRATVAHVYEPRGGCKAVFEARDEEVLISGPAGTGKSRACLEKLFLVCLLTRNVRGLMLRKTLRSLGSTALVTWRNYVIREALSSGQVVYYGGSSQEAPQYRFKNGSTITIGGLDKPTRIMSSEYDIVYVQEATEISIEDLEMIKTRLRNWRVGFQQLLMDCNPAAADHWLKLRCDDHVCKLIESRHEDNPRLFDEVVNEDGTITHTVTANGAKYIGILDRLTGVRYKRLRLGLWVSAEGIVYEEFDPAIHILPWEYDEQGNQLPLPVEWPRYWAIDFGYTNPFVLKCYAEGPDGELYMYREIYMTRRTVADHALTILDIVAPEVHTRIENHINGTEVVRTTREWIEPQPETVICDHDAEGRRTFSDVTGLGTVAAIKNVYEGINACKERLKQGADGFPRFFLMEDALVERDSELASRMLPTCTNEEYGSYVWKIDASGRTLDEPVKRDDHGVDTDRYMIMDRDWRGDPRYTEIG